MSNDKYFDESVAEKHGLVSVSVTGSEVAQVIEALRDIARALDEISYSLEEEPRIFNDFDDAA